MSKQTNLKSMSKQTNLKSMQKQANLKSMSKNKLLFVCDNYRLDSYCMHSIVTIISRAVKSVVIANGQ
jgi:hypothetical protein